MNTLEDLLDKDEKILWQEEGHLNLIPDFEGFKHKRKHKFIVRMVITIVFLVFNFYLIFFINILFVACLVLALLIWIDYQEFIKNFEKKRKKYTLMKKYYTDDELKDYTGFNAITNRHWILFSPLQHPRIYLGVDVSHIYEYRREYCFYNLEAITHITKSINPKKKKYKLILYFELAEHYLVGDEALHFTLTFKKEGKFEEILTIFSRNAPNAKITNWGEEW